MNPLLVVNTVGTQEEMGAQHGALLREHGGWEDSLRMGQGLPPRMMLARYKRPIDAWLVGVATPVIDLALRRLQTSRPAPLRARTEAFMQALGLPASTARLVGIMDVFQNAVGTLTRWGMVPFAQRAAAALPPACSTLAAWGDATTDGRVLHARNFDLPANGLWDRSPEVVFCTPDEGLRYGFVTTRGADVPGVTAFNEAGLTITAHTRFHRDVRFDGALVVDLGHEIARRASTLGEAIAIVRERPIASCWGLAISSATERRAVIVETSASSVQVVEAEPGDEFVATANRFLSPALQIDEVAPSANWIDHSQGRLAAMRAWGREGGLDVPALQRMLADHGDAQNGGTRAAGGVLCQAITVQSIVADPERRCLHVAVGTAPVQRGPWIEVPWTWDDAPGARVVPIPDDHQPVGAYAEGPAAEAYAHYVEAVRLEQWSTSVDAVSEHIDAAVTLDPDDPTWRFLAGALALRTADWPAALAHFERGLANEQAPFHRGRHLLWASRAAEVAGRTDHAESLRRELLTLHHPLLAGYQAAAWREGTRPMAASKLRTVPIDLTMADAGF